MSSGNRWEHAVLGLLDDLEMQAEGLHLAERAVEVEELSVAEYAEVPLLARLHASIGHDVRVAVEDGLEIRGQLGRVGRDWFVVDDAHAAWFVNLSAVQVLTGLTARSVPDEARPLAARLSMRSVLRRLVEDRHSYAIHLRGGRVVHGALVRVGADFAEVRPVDVADTVVLALAAVVAIRDAG